MTKALPAALIAASVLIGGVLFAAPLVGGRPPRPAIARATAPATTATPCAISGDLVGDGNPSNTYATACQP